MKKSGLLPWELIDFVDKKLGLTPWRRNRLIKYWNEKKWIYQDFRKIWHKAGDGHVNAPEAPTNHVPKIPEMHISAVNISPAMVALTDVIHSQMIPAMVISTGIEDSTKVLVQCRSGFTKEDVLRIMMTTLTHPDNLTVITVTP